LKKLEIANESLTGVKHVFVKKSVGKLDMRDTRKYDVVPSIFRADLICVDSLSAIHTVTPTTNSKGATVNLMDHAVLAARLLGLRLVTPVFCKQTMKQQRTDASSVTFTPLVRSSPVYLHITSDFEKRQGGSASLLRHACGKSGSKWKVVDDKLAFNAYEKTGKTCVHIAQLADLHSMILAAPLCIDKLRTSSGAFLKASPQAPFMC
jgi:hypothetical protein